MAMTPTKTHRTPDEGPTQGLLRPEISMADSVRAPSRRKSSEGDESIVLIRVVRGGSFEPFAIGERSDITKYLGTDDPERWREKG
jgi:hypothetical protein